MTAIALTPITYKSARIFVVCSVFISTIFGNNNPSSFVSRSLTRYSTDPKGEFCKENRKESYVVRVYTQSKVKLNRCTTDILQLSLVEKRREKMVDARDCVTIDIGRTFWMIVKTKTGREMGIHSFIMYATSKAPVATSCSRPGRCMTSIPRDSQAIPAVEASTNDPERARATN